MAKLKESLVRRDTYPVVMESTSVVEQYMGTLR
jgi:hypothetical protein